MRASAVFGAAVLLFMTMTGCEPDEQYHARILGGRLRGLYLDWSKKGRPEDFVTTNYFYNVGSSNQYFWFTNTVTVQNNQLHCRFAIRDPRRFQGPGLLAITDEGVLLWVGDDGKVVLAPDTKNWSSRPTRNK